MVKNIPIPNWKDAELDIATNWDKYIGAIWANIFIECNLPEKGIVVEIAPGVAEKIGRGLELYGFKGTLYVVEPEEFSLNEITRKYREHIPGCTVIPIQKTLREAIDILPKKVDAIVANHPLDDMILASFLMKKDFVEYFGEKFGTNFEKTKFFWNKIEENKIDLEKSKSEILEEWQTIIEKIKPSFLAIAQYRSYFFAKNKLFSPDKNAFDVLNLLRKKYSKYDNKKIIKNITAFNADIAHWMVLKFK